MSGCSTFSSSPCYTFPCEPLPPGPSRCCRSHSRCTTHAAHPARPASWLLPGLTLAAPGRLPLQAPVCCGGGPHLFGAPHSACCGAVGGGPVCVLQVRLKMGGGQNVGIQLGQGRCGEGEPCGGEGKQVQLHTAGVVVLSQVLALTSFSRLAAKATHPLIDSCPAPAVRLHSASQSTRGGVSGRPCRPGWESSSSGLCHRGLVSCLPACTRVHVSGFACHRSLSAAANAASS